MSDPKILFLDIETAPMTAYVWGLYDQNIAINQIVDTGRVLSFAAKWRGNKTMHYTDERTGRHELLSHVHDLLSQADAVVHYNGTKFDIPTLNKEFVEWGYPPPASFRQIDLLKTARSKFKFPSNKLEYVAKQLDLGSKGKTGGMQLWVDCMNGDELAWKKMEAYNKQDVILLEKLYDKFLPWIQGGINHGIGNPEMVCPKCGSDDLQKRGYAYVDTMAYQRYQCNACGSWCREKSGEVGSFLKEAA
jgi:uncharacterized protein YprB with RNaseH-like and TPR domain